MRIWDVPPSDLCRKHLLAEHRELHAVWTILSAGKKGYSNHPETRRWVGKLASLYFKHELLVREMRKRKYHHYSARDKKLAKGEKTQDIFFSNYRRTKNNSEKQKLRLLQRVIVFLSKPRYKELLS